MMNRKHFFTLILLAFTTLTFGQNLNRVDEVVKLAKIYRGNHGLSGLDGQSTSIFSKYNGTEFETSARFIEEDHTEESAKIISLKEVTELDQTVNDLYEMPVKVGAERNTVEDKWTHFKLQD